MKLGLQQYVILLVFFPRNPGKEKLQARTRQFIKQQVKGVRKFLVQDLGTRCSPVVNCGLVG